MKIAFVALMFLCAPVRGLAQQAPSPYAGQETRAIKALAEDEVEALLDGDGMGFAKVAELNHYPGPRHVLDLSETLELTADQLHRTESVFESMRESAVALGQRIVDAEARLDDEFSNRTIDRSSLEAQLTEIARLNGELRATHLLAHLEMVEILTSHQIARYDSLRGYADHAGADHGHHQRR